MATEKVDVYYNLSDGRLAYDDNGTKKLVKVDAQLNPNNVRVDSSTCSLEMLDFDGAWVQVLDEGGRPISLKGDPGKAGTNGKTPYIKNGTWWFGPVDSEIEATGPQGPQGPKGDPGESVDLTEIEADIKLLAAKVEINTADIKTLKTDSFSKSVSTKFIETSILPKCETICILSPGKYKITADVSTTPVFSSFTLIEPFDTACIVIGDETSLPFDSTQTVYNFGEEFTIEDPDTKVSIAFANSELISYYISAGIVDPTEEASENYVMNVDNIVLHDLNSPLNTTIASLETNLNALSSYCGADVPLTTTKQTLSEAINELNAKTLSMKIESDNLKYSIDGGSSWTDLGKVVGDDGKDGIDGANGTNGVDGKDGVDMTYTTKFPDSPQGFDTILWTGPSITSDEVPCGYTEPGVVYQYLPSSALPGTYEKTRIIITETTTDTPFTIENQALAKLVLNSYKLNPSNFVGITFTKSDLDDPDSTKVIYPLCKCYNIGIGKAGQDFALAAFIEDHQDASTTWTATESSSPLDSQMYWVPINEVLATM